MEFSIQKIAGKSFLKAWFYTLFLTLFVFTPASYAEKQSGGSDTGGGTTVEHSSGRRVLLDLYSLNQNRSRGIQLNSHTLRSRGVDYLCVNCGAGKGLLSRDTRLTGLIQQKLTWLQTHSRPATQVLRQALMMPVIVLNAPAPLLSEAAAHSYAASASFDNLPEQVISTARVAAGFTYQQMIGMSAREFNRLSLEDQAGLLIHEALRVLQIQHRRQVSNQQLQDLVLAIMSSDDSLLSLQVLENTAWSASRTELLERKNAACERLHSLLRTNSEAAALNWTDAQLLCQDAAVNFAGQLEQLQKAHQNVYQNRPRLLRTVSTEAQADEVMQLSDAFEALFLSNITNALSQNDPVFNSVEMRAPHIFDFVTIDQANGR